MSAVVGQRYFLIAALPRSRTAWLANLLTAKESFCHHELLRQVKPWEVRGTLEARPERFVGDSEPCLSLYFNAVLKQVPNAAIVVVDRPVEAARESYRAVMHGHVSEDHFNAAWERMAGDWEAMKAALAERRTLRVDYADMDREETCREIWEHCLPGVPWDAERWRLLDSLRVTAHVDKVKAVVTSPEWSPPPPEPPGPEPVESSALNPTTREYLAIVKEICGDDGEAWRWFLQVMEVMLTWDHLEDDDALDKPMMNRTFETLVLDWPRNDWWQRHKLVLLPVMSAGLAAWRASNAGGPRQAAYELYINLPLALAYLKGGQARVSTLGPRLRSLMQREQIQNDEQKLRAIA